MPDEEMDTTPEPEAPAVAKISPITAAVPPPSDMAKVRLTSGIEYFLDDFYAKAGTPMAEEVKNRRKPRVQEEGDPMVRGFIWSGTPAFECRYTVEFQGPEDGPNWSMACCKTYFTLGQLRDHWLIEHDGEVLPEFEA